MAIIVFIFTALIQAAVSAAGFFMLILGMNGFNERDAKPGLLFYVLLGVATTLGLALGSALAANGFVKKKAMGKLAAAALSVFGFSAVGVVIMIVGFFVALLIASIMHDMR